MSEHKSERQIGMEDVYEEHQRSVNANAHWAYLFGVLFGGFVLMIALIALLGASGA